MLNDYTDVLKYCKDEYGFIVFKGEESIHEPGEFWTLEKTEDDAKRRVKNETEAYDSPDFQFYYRPIERKEVKYVHKCTVITEVRVKW